MAIKNNQQKNFTMVDNTLLNRKDLSAKAKFVMCYLMSKPESWEFSYTGMMSQMKEGKRAIGCALVELVAHKLLLRVKKDDSVYYDFILYPTEEDLRENKDPLHGKVDTPTKCTPTKCTPHSNTKLSNTKLSNTEIKNKNTKKNNFELFTDEVKKEFADKKILTFSSKINTTKATKDVFSQFKSTPFNLASRYADYIVLNKSKGVRLDKWLMAVFENNESEINYGVETPKEKRTTTHDAVDAYFAKKNCINVEACDE